MSVHISGLVADVFWKDTSKDHVKLSFSYRKMLSELVLIFVQNYIEVFPMDLLSHFSLSVYL